MAFSCSSHGLTSKRGPIYILLHPSAKVSVPPVFFLRDVPSQGLLKFVMTDLFSSLKCYEDA